VICRENSVFALRTDFTGHDDHIAGVPARQAFRLGVEINIIPTYVAFPAETHMAIGEQDVLPQPVVVGAVRRGGTALVRSRGTVSHQREYTVGEFQGTQFAILVEVTEMVAIAASHGFPEAGVFGRVELRP
jgi:hypothetical protein